MYCNFDCHYTRKKVEEREAWPCALSQPTVSLCALCCVEVRTTLVTNYGDRVCIVMIVRLETENDWWIYVHWPTCAFPQSNSFSPISQLHTQHIQNTHKHDVLCTPEEIWVEFQPPCFPPLLLYIVHCIYIVCLQNILNRVQQPLSTTAAPKT